MSQGWKLNHETQQNSDESEVLQADWKLYDHESQQNVPSDKSCAHIKLMCFLSFDNEFSQIMYSLFGGKQTIFLTLFSTNFVIKCAAKNLKIV